MRRSFWIVWVDPKSNAKYLYKRHAEERHNEEKSVWRWGKRLVGCGHSEEHQQSLDAGRGMDWTLPYVLVGSTVLTVDLRPPALWQNEVPFLQANKFAYMLHICCVIFVTYLLQWPWKPIHFLWNHLCWCLDHWADWVLAAWRIIELVQDEHHKCIFMKIMRSHSKSKEVVLSNLHLNQLQWNILKLSERQKEGHWRKESSVLDSINITGFSIHWLFDLGKVIQVVQAEIFLSLK